MNIDFSRNLIKGKITEVIFEEMFRSSEKFTIIPLGYEHTTPILAQYQHHVHIQKVLENIRHAPDFALVSQNKENVYLVEVKYRSRFDKQDILEIANKIHTTWNPCYLFIASRDNFYFSPCSSIIDKGGEIEELRESWIKKDTQQKYSSLLKEFIK
ncbi:hypothetical protein KKF69_03015 [Patescibacteria group bacterium]|nr:hypothetical protein [Patescibacteria group bacterium]